MATTLQRLLLHEWQNKTFTSLLSDSGTNYPLTDYVEFELITKKIYFHGMENMFVKLTSKGITLSNNN